MDLSLRLGVEPSERWRLAQQMDVTHAVTNLPNVGEDADPWAFEPLLEMQNRFGDHGFEVDVIESRPPMEDVVLGRPGRDAQIDAVCELVANMGRLGIDTYCWVWTENPLGVLRTSRTVPDRGDSRQSGYDHAQMQRGPRHPADVTETELWENLEYFLERVVPVAEDAGVNLALHPDDPPVSPIRGIDRLVTSVANYERILDLYPSERHGVCLCQGNFALMEEPIPEVIRRLDERIHFVHFRDVEGCPEQFVETWHDDGPTDMAACIRAYEAVGFDGPIRPDHVGAMGESGSYDGTRGRLWAIGYMRGLIDQHHSTAATTE
ncbi:MAG: mannonate dehydratase [Haloarculaceae archaeon]